MKIPCKTCGKIVMEKDGKFCRVLLRREEDAIVIDCPMWFLHRDCSGISKLSTDDFIESENSGIIGTVKI